MSVFKAFFDGYKAGKKESGAPKYKDSHYKAVANCPFLCSWDYVNDLIDHSQSPEQEDLILDHLYAHKAEEFEWFGKLEKKIIDRRWKE